MPFYDTRQFVLVKIEDRFPNFRMPAWIIALALVKIVIDNTNVNIS